MILLLFSRGRVSFAQVPELTMGEGWSPWKKKKRYNCHKKEEWKQGGIIWDRTRLLITKTRENPLGWWGRRNGEVWDGEIKLLMRGQEPEQSLSPEDAQCILMGTSWEPASVSIWIEFINVSPVARTWHGCLFWLAFGEDVIPCQPVFPWLLAGVMWFISVPPHFVYFLHYLPKWQPTFQCPNLQRERVWTQEGAKDVKGAKLPAPDLDGFEQSRTEPSNTGNHQKSNGMRPFKVAKMLLFYTLLLSQCSSLAFIYSFFLSILNYKLFFIISEIKER